MNLQTNSSYSHQSKQQETKLHPRLLQQTGRDTERDRESAKDYHALPVMHLELLDALLVSSNRKIFNKVERKWSIPNSLMANHYAYDLNTKSS